MVVIGAGFKRKLETLVLEFNLCREVKTIEDGGGIVTSEVLSKGPLGIGTTYKRIDFMDAAISIANSIKSKAGGDDVVSKFKADGCQYILDNIGKLNGELIIDNLMALSSIRHIPVPKKTGPSEEELKKQAAEKEAKIKEQEEAKAKKLAEQEEARKKKEEEQKNRQVQAPKVNPEDTEMYPFNTEVLEADGSKVVYVKTLSMTQILDICRVELRQGKKVLFEQ
jgi:hypothetical protein